MKRVAVFGKPGGGKSTLSRNLAKAIGVELYPLDLVEYKPDGKKVCAEAYVESHRNLIKKEEWIIEGLGTLDSFWQRIDSADTLIYVDLPYWQHYWFATKRLLKSPFVSPEGWPEGSSIIKGTIASWKYLRLSPRFWTDELLVEINNRARGKSLFHIKSASELKGFIKNNVGENQNT